MRPQRSIYWLLSLTFSAAILYYIFTEITWAQVRDLITQSDQRALAAFLLLSLATSVFRTWRYSLLLGQVGYQVSQFSLFLVVLVRNCLADLLPARVGSLIYVVLITSRLGVPIASATSSFALAFVLDLLALLPLLILALLTLYQSSTELAFSPVIIFCIVGFGTAALFIYLPALMDFASSISLKMKFLKPKVRERVQDFLTRIGNDVKLIKETRIMPELLTLSLLIRLGKYGALYIFLFALLKPLGYTLAQLPLSKVFIGLLASESAASLPISGIAGFGVYQGAWSTTFSLLGFPGDVAKLTSVAHHLFTQAYGYGLGLVALLIIGLPWMKSKVGPSRASSFSRMKFFSRIVSSLIFLASLLWLVLSQA